MRSRINRVELLTIKSREDNATHLTINNINISKCKNINGEMRCNFLCHCGEKR